MHEDSISGLNAVKLIARAYRIPLGIVIGVDKSLCTEQKRIDLSNATAEEAFSAVLRNTLYTSTRVGKTFSIAPTDETPLEQSLLSRQLGAVTPPKNSMYAIGVYYEGWLEAALHPKQGYGFSILGQTTDVPISFSPEDTVTEVLNSLVSKGGGGLWFMQTPPNSDANDQASATATIVQVYSYADNDQDIQNLSCAK